MTLNIKELQEKVLALGKFVGDRNRQLERDTEKNWERKVKENQEDQVIKDMFS